MRILVLSDLHANATALGRRPNAAKDRWDIPCASATSSATGPIPMKSQPACASSAHRPFAAITTKAVTGLMATDDFLTPSQNPQWIGRAPQLQPEHLAVAIGFAPGPLATDGVGGSSMARFTDEDEYVFTPAQALDGLLDSTAPVTFFGHNPSPSGLFLPGCAAGGPPDSPSSQRILAALRIELQRRYLLNPGSIGQPRDGDPRAAFAIADLEHQVIEFWRVPYDISLVQTAHACRAPSRASGSAAPSGPLKSRNHCLCNKFQK